MKWKTNKYKKGDCWYIEHKRFLLIPKKIGDETRWLEWAEWIESATETKSIDVLNWIDEKWIN